MKRNWTNEELCYIKENYCNKYTIEIATKLNRSVRSVYQAANTLGLKKTKEFMQIALERESQKLKILGTNTRFKPGHSTYNKGQKMSKAVYDMVKVSMFKKGNEPHNMKYDGHERICAKDGYVYIRISSGVFLLLKYGANSSTRCLLLLCSELLLIV